MTIKRIAIVGAGLMGHGIAQEFAGLGYEIYLHSRTAESLNKAIKNIKANLDLLAKIKQYDVGYADTVLTKIHPTTDLNEAANDVDLVIESVYEDITLKQYIFQELDKICSPHTILTSNTSTFPISEVAPTSNRADKLLIMHFANPPYLIPIVELVKGPATSEITLQEIQALLIEMGKWPIILHKEVPGFILNRLQVALLREALWLIQNGVASAEEIDTVIKGSIGRRWAVAGIFEIFDIAGWDLIYSITSTLLPHLSSSSEVLSVLTEKLDKGELGVKSGQGFYEWTPESVDEIRGRIMYALSTIDKWQSES